MHGAQPRLRVAAAVVLCAAMLAACGGGSDAPTKIPARSTSESPSEVTQETFEAYALVIASDAIALLDEEPAKCNNLDRTRGIAAGDQILLRDASGSTVSVAELEVASGSDLEQKPESACVWTATFSDVPTGGDFYEAKLSDRVSETVAEADLATDRLVIRVD